MIDWPDFLDFSGRQAFWTILVGCLCHASCALLGCFLVLRRMSMLGDAISHAVLPGLVLAFIVTGGTAVVPMFVGAALFAILTAGLSWLLHNWGHTTEESGLGIVFTAFFALGILLVQLYAENVHIDRDAVLEGAVEFVTLNTVTIVGREWPVAFWVSSLVLAIVLLWLLLFWKQIKTATFDPAYAAAIGLYGQTMLLSIIVLTALCVVSAFQVVGSVLVVAMLVVPAASAQLICHTLSRMILVSVLYAMLATASGYYLAWYANTSAAGMMAVMTGCGYLLTILFSPQQGIVFIRWKRWQLQRNIASEDLLGLLYRLQERRTQTVSVSQPEIAHLLGHSVAAGVYHQLIRSGLIMVDQYRRYSLTTQGLEHGSRIVRGHRLWESFLGQEFSLPPDHVHPGADRIEHFLDSETREQLAQRLDSPTADPHGRQIPAGE